MLKNKIDDNEKEKNFKLDNKKKDNINNRGCCKKNKKKWKENSFNNCFF